MGDAFDWDALIQRVGKGAPGTGMFVDHHIYLAFDEHGDPKAITATGLTDGTFLFPPPKYRSKNYFEPWRGEGMIIEANPDDPTRGTIKRYVKEQGFVDVATNAPRATYGPDGRLVSEGWLPGNRYATKAGGIEQRGGAGSADVKALALKAAETLLDFAAA